MKKRVLPFVSEHHDPLFHPDVYQKMDEEDSLTKNRKGFNIPQNSNVVANLKEVHKGVSENSMYSLENHLSMNEMVYFTGHSLGLQPKTYSKYLNQELEDWKLMGVDGHFNAKTPWVDYHKSLTKSTAKLVGAKEEEVVTMNGLSVNLHLLLTSFYNPTKKKYKILCEPNLFPSDLYILQSQIKLKGFDPLSSLIFLPTSQDGVVLESTLHELIDLNKNELALIFLGGVNYYTGQVFDIEKITKHAHDHDIMVGFDLAHAVGNIELNLHHWNVDFAAWCSYKYLNSGPGNVSTIFIHKSNIKKSVFRLAGWWGHESKSRFSIQKEFNPINTAEGWQLSNAPVLGMSIYRVSLEMFDEIGMSRLIDKRIKLSNYLEKAIRSVNDKQGLIDFKIITPGPATKRGSQLSVLITLSDLYKESHPKLWKSSDSIAKKIYNELIYFGFCVDWRDPNIIRIAPVPMYNTFEDVARFYDVLLNMVYRYDVFEE